MNKYNFLKSKKMQGALLDQPNVSSVNSLCALRSYFDNRGEVLPIRVVK